MTTAAGFHGDEAQGSLDDSEGSKEAREPKPQNAKRAKSTSAPRIRKARFPSDARAEFALPFAPNVVGIIAP